MPATLHVNSGRRIWRPQDFKDYAIASEYERGDGDTLKML